MQSNTALCHLTGSEPDPCVCDSRLTRDVCVFNSDRVAFKSVGMVLLWYFNDQLWLAEQSELWGASKTDFQRNSVWQCLWSHKIQTKTKPNSLFNTDIVL